MAAAEDLKVQLESLKAQEAQMRARLAELESQTPERLAAAPDSAVPSAPAALALPPAPLPAGDAATVLPSAPLPAALPSAPLPADDATTCVTLDVIPRAIPCPKPEDNVDLGELFGGAKSVGQVFDVLPSWEQLQRLDTLLPIIGGTTVLSFGLWVSPKVTEALRPNDLIPWDERERLRKERERLGISETEYQEQEAQAARDKWFGAVIPAILIVGFELALFNLRNVNF